MDRNLIDRYQNGASALREAVAGLDPGQLKQHPVPGTWSIHEIVVHLADSDSIASDRMKRIITQDNPSVLAFDHDKYMSLLYPEQQSVEDALLVFEANRRQTARILRLLPDAAFQRIGTHNERGEIKLETMVEFFCNHLDHHLKFLRDKRHMIEAASR